MKSSLIPMKSSSIRRTCSLLLVALFAVGVLGRPASAQDSTAQGLLAATASAMSEVESFQFVITTDNGKVVILDKFELGRVEGRVQQPDRLQAQVSGKVKGLPVTANVIVIGEDIWAATTPRADKYSKVDSAKLDKLQMETEFDPTEVLLKAIDYVQNPEITGEEDVNGVVTNVVKGTVDLSQIGSGTPQAGISQTPVEAIIWIDGENLVQQLQIIGPLLDTEPEGIVHQLVLSNYNEPVIINAP